LSSFSGAFKTSHQTETANNRQNQFRNSHRGLLSIRHNRRVPVLLEILINEQAFSLVDGLGSRLRVVWSAAALLPLFSSTSATFYLGESQWKQQPPLAAERHKMQMAFPVVAL
jgi:hypothetical protein